MKSDIPTHLPAYHGKGRILRLKEGYNPNSSSLGSVVFSIPAALAAAPLILGAAAAYLASRQKESDDD
jgi:hypothetical protein